MHLRPLAGADLEIVRRLRNDNRAAFLDANEVTAEQHLAWFARLESRRVAFYVIEEDGQVAGTISVTEREDAREVGNLTLAVEHRGRGLMRRAVAELTAAPGRYFSEIRPENEVSRRLFRSLGFVERLDGPIVRAWKTVGA
jgi:RimJ/RimL family protein N-acetyltransferase